MLKLLPDVLAVIGAILISYGCWLAFPPSGFVIGGVLLIIGALAANKSK